MQKPIDLTEQELRELRKYFEPQMLCNSSFNALCNALLKTGQLIIDKMIIEKASLRGR